MDLWRLKVFCKVVESGGFSSAAKELLLSQPTVSSHMKDLEEHYGCRLVDRIGKKIVLTGAGELLYRGASELLALHDRIEAQMADRLGRVAGRLVIGGSTIPSVYIIPGLIGEYRRAYPDVTVSLVTGDTAYIVSQVAAGRIEAGVVGAMAKDPAVVQEPIVNDEMKLIVPPGHPWAKLRSVDVGELVHQPFIIRERGSGTLDTFAKALAAKGLSITDLNVVAEMGSTEAVIRGVRSGIGVSVVSKVAALEYVESGSLAMVSVSGIDLSRKFYLTFLRSRTLSPAGKAFVEMARGCVSD